GAAQIKIVSIEIVEPVGRRPVITGIAGKDRPRLKTNHGFTAAPCPSSLESVTGGNERIIAVTGDTAYTPYGATGPVSVAGAHAVTTLDGSGLSIGTPISQP